jgi:riboflavin biosynthesis pyrimidine reductase
MIVTNVMAMSLDGAIASNSRETDAERQDAGITTNDDQEHLRSLIAGADGIIVGARSVISSGGLLDVKRADGQYPRWVVLSRAGVPEDASFLEQTAIPRCLVLGPKALTPKPRALLDVRSSGDLGSEHVAYQYLHGLGCQNILLFGGSAVNQIFYNSGLVDRLILTISPVLLGQLSSVPLVAPPLSRPINLQLVASQPHGNLVFLTYDVVKC